VSHPGRHLPVLAAAALAAMVGCATSGAPGPERGYRAVVAAPDLAGHPVGRDPAVDATVVVVFASWCHPCRKELAMLEQLAASEPRLRVVGVNAYEEWDDRSDQQRLRHFLADRHPWLRVVHGDGHMLAAFGGVPKVPSLFVYDRDGHLLAAYQRARRPPPDAAELRQALAPALGSGQRSAVSGQH